MSGLLACILMCVSIREANASDLELVCRMRLEFVAEYRKVLVDDLPESFVEQTRVFVDRAQRAGRIRSWLAEDNVGCIGAVSLLLFDVPPLPEDPRTSQGYIVDMYVLSRQRRQGIGGGLFDACVTTAAQLEVRRLFLRATDDGRPLYLRAGFKPNDEWLELSLPAKR